MKTFLYSGATKAFFVLLFLVSLTLGILDGVRIYAAYVQDEDFVKDIGKPVEESYHFRTLLNIPENELVETYWEYAAGMKGIPESVRSDFYEELRQRFKSHTDAGCIEYYVNLDGLVFANVKDPKSLKQGFYKYYINSPYGLREFYSGGGTYLAPDHNNSIICQIPTKNLTIAVRVAPDYAEKYGALLDRQELVLFTGWATLLLCALGLILSLVYLICVCGRDAKGNRKSLWVDRIWTEFHLILAGGPVVGAGYLAVFVVEAAYSGLLTMNAAYVICGTLSVFAGGLILSCVLSLVRNLKAGQFVKRSAVLFVLNVLAVWCRKLCRRIWSGLCWGIRLFASLRGLKYALVQLGLLVCYSLVTFLLAAEAAEGNGAAWLILLPLIMGAALLIALKERDFYNIQQGANRVGRGDLSHRIAEPAIRHLKPLAEDINHIAMGLDASLAARIRAEQMKTELITNVSHDLKTPLTSIITYTELLSRTENLPQEARDYLRIIENKSQRLKSLTQDLFDISKAQSGNEEVQWERLDAALLLEQSLAEENDTEGLQFCLKTEENLFFMGDGRKISRVLGNLIQNAVKYALPGTRVFLSACQEGNQVVMECKNISAYPLDFRPEEILGRFVRGDSARSTEGNGLGLPIAKSYTELCGGTFRLVLDGDLFKVILRFPSA